MSNPKETESEAFRKWFSSQKTFSSLSAMERALNITKGYLHLVADGARRAADPELRRKLREATGLQAFDPSVGVSTKLTRRVTGTSKHARYGDQGVGSEERPSPSAKILKQPIDSGTLIQEFKNLREKVDQIDTKLTEAEVYREITRNPTATSAEQRARTVLRLLMSLSKELEFFKSCTEDERRIFKKTVPGQDVGYITTLLRALYDEDRFQKWLFFSTYRMKGKENGE